MTTHAEVRPLTCRLDLAAPLDLRGYESEDGYVALRKVIKEMQPAEVTQLVKEANLRGRGGAGFPAGVKWSAGADGRGRPATEI
jgi:NADH-quinone oxidoreductase subunit F